MQSKPVKDAALSSLKKILLSAFIGAGTAITVLLIIALIMTKANLLGAGVHISGITALILGGFIGGFTAAKLKKSNGLLYGALCGAVMYLMFILAEFATFDRNVGTGALYKLIITVSSAAIGGIAGVNTSKKLR